MRRVGRRRGGVEGWLSKERGVGRGVAWSGMFQVLIVVLGCVLWFPDVVEASTLSLGFVVQPGNATAAVPFSPAPVVEILDTNGDRDVSVGNETVAIAELLGPEAALATLQRQGVGVNGTSTAAVASFSNGTATFSGLVVDRAGLNYRLEVYVAGVRGVISETFRVDVGPPWGLVVVDDVGRATGGLEFAPQPALAVVDAGRNTIWWDNVTQVNVSLLQDGSGQNATLSGQKVVQCVSGVAQFLDLSIDKAGDGFVLEFDSNADQVHPELATSLQNYTGPLGMPPVVSDNASMEITGNVTSRSFTVGVGPTANLRLVIQPDGARGGEPFTSQPVLVLEDAGGNVNVQDNHTQVTVTLWRDGASPRQPDVLEGDGVGGRMWGGREDFPNPKPLYQRPGGATLGPSHLYRRYSVGDVVATATHGSVWVNVTGGAARDLSILIPPVQAGSRIALGIPPGDLPGGSWWGKYLARDPTTGSWMDEYADPDALCAALLLSPTSSLTSLADLGIPCYPMRPLPGTDGALVRSVDESDAQWTRVRLHDPWPFADAEQQPLTQIETALTRTASQGRVTFENLTIDRVGDLFALRFDASLRPEPEASLLGRGRLGYGIRGFGFGYGGDGVANVSTTSNVFAVEVGSPFALRVDVPPAGAWAGAQPFLQQPVVSLVDRGGNVVESESHVLVRASLRRDQEARNDTQGLAFAIAAAPLLTGNTSTYLERGRAIFSSLGVARRGEGFVLRFTASVPGFGTMTVDTRLDVGPSAEWQLRPHDAEPGDLFGFSVAADDSLAWAAVGAPRDRRPVEEVQVVEVLGPELEPQTEVQALSTVLLFDDGPDFTDGDPLVDGSAPNESGSEHLAGREAQRVVVFPDPDLFAASLATNGSEVRDALVAEKMSQAYFYLSLSGFITRSIGVTPLLGGFADHVRVSAEADLAGAGVGSLRVEREDDDVAEGWCREALEELHTAGDSVFNRSVYANSTSNMTCIGSASFLITYLDRDSPHDPSAVLGGGDAALRPLPPVGTGEQALRLYSWRVHRGARIRGTFTLSLGNRTSTPLAHDILPQQLESILETELAAGDVQISRRQPPRAGGSGPVYEWYITFSQRTEGYDVPLLQVDDSELHVGRPAAPGVSASAYTTTIRDGRGALGGTFALYFRGSGPTPPIPYDASAAEFKAAVEAIDTIDTVRVSRDGPLASLFGGYAWTVTFEAVREPREFSPFAPFALDEGPLDHPSDIEPLDDANAPYPLTPDQALALSIRAGIGARAQAYQWTADGETTPTPMLLGSGSFVRVRHTLGTRTEMPWNEAIHGSTGAGAGSVYVFRRAPSLDRVAWLPHPGGNASLPLATSASMSRLRGHDVDEEDLFGWSVATAGGFVVAGAPGAADRGELEQQKIVCGGDEGRVWFQWRGHETVALQWNATAAEVRDALEALPSLPRVRVSHDSGVKVRPMCDSRADIDGAKAYDSTAATPDQTLASTRGALTVTFIWPRDHDLEPITVSRSTISLNGTQPTSKTRLVKVLDDWVQGTALSSGVNVGDKIVDGVATGAAYIFTPASAATDDQLLAASASSPSARAALAAQGISADARAGWVQVARLTAPEPREAGAMTGASVAVMEDGTVAVGSPRSSGEFGLVSGVVYLFAPEGIADPTRTARRPASMGLWSELQTLTARTTNTPTHGAPGDAFGAAVAMHSHTLAVGAPGARGGRGRVYLFVRRPGTGVNFWIDQVLEDPAPSQYGAAGLVLSGTALINFAAAAHPGNSSANSTTSKLAADSWLNDLEQDGICGVETLNCPMPAFGTSVALHNDSLVIGAPGAVHPKSGRQTGVAFAYQRGSYFDFFEEDGVEVLVRTDTTEGMQAGRSVAISGRVAVVGASEADGSPDGARETGAKEVQQIQTFPPSINGTVSGAFRIEYRREPQRVGRGFRDGRYESARRWVRRRSRALSHDAEAWELRDALQLDLGTGRVNVTRYGPSTTGAYLWRVTFQHPPPIGNLPLLHADGSALTGSITVIRAEAAAERVRGSATVFVNEPSTLGGAWVETAALHPQVQQRADLFGRSVAASGGVALVGATNRDFAPGGGHAGAAMAFDLEMLNARIHGALSADVGTTEANGLEVVEGEDDSMQVYVSLCDPECIVSPRSASDWRTLAGGAASLVGWEDGWGLALSEERSGERFAEWIDAGGEMRSADESSAPWIPSAPDVSDSNAVLSWLESRWNITGLPQARAFAWSLAGPGDLVADLHVVPGDDTGTHDATLLHACSNTAARAAATAASGPEWCTPESTDRTGASINAWGRGDLRNTGFGAPLATVVDKNAPSPSSCSFRALPGLLLRKTAYDWRGEGDFSPVPGRPIVLRSIADAIQAGTSWPPPNVSVPVVITDDDVAEADDEYLFARLRLPGIEPLFAGRLWALGTVTDDADGVDQTRSYSQRVFAQEFEEEEDDDDDDDDDDDGLVAESGGLFGADVVVQGDVGVTGSPGAASGDGRVFLLVASGSLWSTESTLEPPTSGLGGRFGAAVAASPISSWTPTSPVPDAIAVLEPHTALVHFFAPEWIVENRDDSNGIVNATTAPPSSAAEGVANWTLASSLSLRLVPEGAEGDGEVSLGGALSGARGVQLAMSEDPAGGGLIVAVGVPSAEVVVVMRNPNPRFAGGGLWVQTATIRSSQYHPVRWLEQWQIVPEGFGSSVSLSGTTLVVGAPLGNGAQISDPVTWSDFNQLAPRTIAPATGAVYLFELIRGAGEADLLLADGDDDDVDTSLRASPWTTLAGWNAGDLGEEDGDLYPSAYALPAELNVSSEALRPRSLARRGVNVIPEEQFYENATSYLDGIDATADAANYLASRVPERALWIEAERFLPWDAEAGARFGSSVAIDGDGLLVGAPGSSAPASTTWNFETGDLQGWTAQGDAFEAQPTWGDNSALRPGYVATANGIAAPPTSSRHRGRFWIGTYEHRPGIPGNITEEPVEDEPGAIQGDEPRGTLTSEVFLIGGARMSMLIGGGCDPSTEYVELLVDGDSVLRATGTCSEEMRRVHWDVGSMRGRAARVRIVDASSTSPWGHINVDDIRFDWSVGVYTDAPRAGAVYAFERRGSLSQESTVDDASQFDERATLSDLKTLTDIADTSTGINGDLSTRRRNPSTRPTALGQRPGSNDALYEPCKRPHIAWARSYSTVARPLTPPTSFTSASSTSSTRSWALNCTWASHARLGASDKRTGAAFGWTVALDWDRGIALVGAPGAVETRPDWSSPGSFAGVRTGDFGLAERSARADGGINAGVDGYSEVSVWASRPLDVPYLLSPNLRATREALGGGARAYGFGTVSLSALQAQASGTASGVRVPSTGAIVDSAVPAGGAGDGAALWADPGGFGATIFAPTPLVGVWDRHADAIRDPLEQSPASWGTWADWTTSPHGAWSGDWVSPLLRNVDDSRGGRWTSGVGDMDMSGRTGLSGGSASGRANGGDSGQRFDTGGGGTGPFPRRGPFDWGSPFAAGIRSGERSTSGQRSPPSTWPIGAWPGERTAAASGSPVLGWDDVGIPKAGWNSGPFGGDVRYDGSDASRISGPARAPEGTVYAFQVDQEIRGGRSRLVRERRWRDTAELARFATPWEAPGWGAGVSVAVDGWRALLGVPNADFPGGMEGVRTQTGALLGLDLEPATVSFESDPNVADRDGSPRLSPGGTHPSTRRGKTTPDLTRTTSALGLEFPEAVVREGSSHGRVVVAVTRPGHRNQYPVNETSLSVQFATRDVTAFGVPRAKFEACASLPPLQRSRAGCGDYAISAGTLHFAPGQTSAAIEIWIVDDACPEPEPEFFAIQLALPGSTALRGPQFTLTVRIDDDDSWDDDATLDGATPGPGVATSTDNASLALTSIAARDARCLFWHHALGERASSASLQGATMAGLFGIPIGNATLYNISEPAAAPASLSHTGGVTGWGY